jgi:serine/threonine protein kinase
MSNPLAAIVCYSCGAKFSARVKSCTRCGSPMSELDLVPGDVIDGRYEIVSLLGIGGMGEVFKVLHGDLQAFRTIKVMRKDLLTDEANRQRFLREARLATRVQHPNVAILHDFSRLADGSYYMVSEFIDGITLRQWLDHYVRFRPEEAIEIALQVLQGLEQCHRAGLLHRDISAVNIMVAAAPIDDAVTAKIIDMGIAKVVAGEQPAGEGTRDGTRVGLFIGNPRYASPEQWGALGDDEKLDGRADLYCLGVVLYEMIAGKPPFSSKTAQGYAPKHLAETPPPFSRSAPGVNVPPELEAVVMKALQKRRNDRWSSAREFARALEPIRNEECMSAMRLRLEAFSRRRSGGEAGDTAPTPGVSATVTGERSGLAPSGPVLPTTPVALPEPLEVREAKAWDAALAANNREGWQRYLDEFGDSQRAVEAEQFRDEALDFERSSSAGLTELRHFLEGWPDGLHAEEARGLLANAERAAMADFERARDAAALTAFLRDHPDSALRERAERRREEYLAFDRASAADTVEAWRGFLAAWPAGERSDESMRRLEAAMERADEIAFTAALSAGSYSAFAAYVESFPSGSRAAEARAAMADLQAFARAEKSGTPAALRKYLQEHRGGRGAREAQELLLALESAARQSALSGGEAECASYLAAFPETPAAASIAERQQSLREQRACDDALANGGDAALAAFIAAYPTSPRTAALRATLEERRARALAEEDGRRVVDARAAAAAGDFRAAEAHAARIGDEELREQTRVMIAEAIDAADWTTAEAAGTANAFTAYLRKHGTGRWAEAARARLDDLAQLDSIPRLEKAKKVEELEALAAKGRNEVAESARAAATRLRTAERNAREAEERAWAAAIAEGTEAAWDRYLRDHRGSPRAAAAKTAAEEASAYAAALRRDRIADWKKFLSRHAAGAHAAAAESRLRALEEEQEERARGAAAEKTREIERARAADEEKARESERARIAAAEKAQEMERTRALAAEKAQETERARIAAPEKTREIERARTQAAEKAQEAARTRETVTEVPKTEAYRRRSRALIAAAAVVVLLAVLAYVGWQQLGPATPAVVPTGNLVVDARPWAEILSIRDASGKEWMRQPGETTPLLLNLPAGTYDVQLRGPNARVQSLKAEITPAATSPVSFVFQQVDVDAYLKAAGW